MTPIDVILEAGAIATGTTVRRLRCPSRGTKVLTARRRFIAGKMRAEGYSFPRIGRAFGGRHHTTVMSWLGAVKPKKRRTR